MNKSSLVLSILIATLCACTNSSQSFIDQNSITEDGINLNFIDEPGSLIAGEEYKLDITHEMFGRKDLIITVNNGSIKRLKPNEDGEVYYVIKPSKEGELKLAIYRNVDGEMKAIGSRILLVEK